MDVRVRWFESKKLYFAVPSCAMTMDLKDILTLSSIILVQLPIIAAKMVDYWDVQAANCKAQNLNEAN